MAHWAHMASQRQLCRLSHDLHKPDLKKLPASKGMLMPAGRAQSNKNYISVCHKTAAAAGHCSKEQQQQHRISIAHNTGCKCLLLSTVQSYPDVNQLATSLFRPKAPSANCVSMEEKDMPVCCTVGSCWVLIS